VDADIPTCRDALGSGDMSYTSLLFQFESGLGTLRAEMPHDIIDNRESYLADAVRPLLNQSARADFAVGYFFLSGFKAIAKELEKISELRLLIGNTSDRATVEQLAEGHASREAILAKQRESEFLNAQQRAKLVAEGERKMRERLERLDQTDEDQALIEQLVRLISEDRLKVKVYTRNRLHAKAYIFDYPTDRFEKGIGIVGSSNLSLAGLQDNTELNVVVHGNANHEQLRVWFNRLWEQEEVINRLESIAFEYKLDVLAERQVDSSRLAIEPAIICTEALL